MGKLIAKIRQWHDKFFGLVSYLQSPFLLFVRLYWGWQLAQSGWASSIICPMSGSISLPWACRCPRKWPYSLLASSFSAGFSWLWAWPPESPVSCSPCNLIMAYIIGDREALLSFFSDPDKFIAAAPFILSDRSLIVLIFGAGQDLGGFGHSNFFFGSEKVKEANSVPV